jgi:DNA polymerase III sliding clamp (beta) subunit (PCNA family)
MRIITTIKEIAEVLPGLLAVIPKRPTHPVLANIHCQTIKENGKEGIRLRATNLQAYLTVFIACDVVEPGECCIPAKLFSDIVTKVKAFGVLELILSGNGEELKIITNNLKQAIKAYDGSEFIEFPQPEKTDKQITVDGIQFFNKIKTLCNHISKNSYTENLNNVHLAYGKLAACDGHKLAYADLKVSKDAPNIFVPPDLIPVLNKLNLVKKLKDQENTDITFSVQEYELTNRDLLFFNFDNWELVQSTRSYKPLPNANLEEGTIYTEVEFDRQHLLSRIKAAIICNEKKITRLWLHLQASNLYFITDNSSDYLEANTSGVIASCLIEAEKFVQIVDSLKTKTIKIKLPHSWGLLGVEVDDFNIGLLSMRSKDHDQLTLDEFVETLGVKSQVELAWEELPQLSTEVNHETEEALPKIKSTAVAVLEPVTTEPTIDSQVKDATTQLQNLLATVTDVQLKEAIVKEVLALV